MNNCWKQIMPVVVEYPNQKCIEEIAHRFVCISQENNGCPNAYLFERLLDKVRSIPQLQQQ